MLDRPQARSILAEVQAELKAGIHPGFQQAVAANALALVLREEELGPALQAKEQERLVKLLELDGTLEDLNHALARGIRSGRIAGQALEAHLIHTSVEKMAVDQPNYPAYRAWKESAK